MAHRRSWGWYSTSCVVALAVLAAPAAAKKVETKALRVADVEGRTLTVRLATPPARGGREGAVGLAVRNRLSASRRIRIRYIPSDAAGRYNVRATATSPRASVDEPVKLATAQGLVVPVSGRDVADVHVTFGAIGDATAEELAGRLVIQPERFRGARVAGSPIVLRVRGVRSEERVVTISPSSVTLPVTRHRVDLTWPPSIDEQDTGLAYVDLLGPGATAYARRGRTATIVVRRDDGKSVRVPVKVVAGRDNTAELTIPGRAVAFDAPGRYEGELPLGSGQSAPKLKLSVTVREWWGLAVLVVLLGVLLGRLVPPVLKRQRLRRRSRDALGDAVARFGASRRGRTEPASYDLDSVITPDRWRLRGLLTRPQDEITRLLRLIDVADDDPAYEECNREAEKLRARVDRWAHVERVARRLCGLLATELPDRRGHGSFASTAAYQDAMTLRWRLKAAPNATQVSSLVSRADRECNVLRLSIEIWRRQARLDERRLDASARRRRLQCELDTLWRNAGPATERDVLRFALLGASLDAANQQLRSMERHNPRRIVGGAGSGALADWIDRDLARAVRVLRAIGRGLRRAFAVVVGWFVRATHWVLTRLRGWLAVLETFSFALSLAVPAAVYVLTLYDSDWGSPLDLLSAFAVGFAGKLALDFGTGGVTVGFADKGEKDTKPAPASPTPDQPAGAPANGGSKRKRKQPEPVVVGADTPDTPDGPPDADPPAGGSVAEATKAETDPQVFEVPGLPLRIMWDGQERPPQTG